MRFMLKGGEDNLVCLAQDLHNESPQFHVHTCLSVNIRTSAEIACIDLD